MNSAKTLKIGTQKVKKVPIRDPVSIIGTLWGTMQKKSCSTCRRLFISCEVANRIIVAEEDLLLGIASLHLLGLSRCILGLYLLKQKIIQ